MSFVGSNITKAAFKRGANKAAGVSALNVGVNRINRFTGNLAKKAMSSTGSALIAGILAEPLIKFISRNPEAAKKQGYPSVLPNNSEFAARNRKAKSSLSTGGTSGGSKLSNSVESQTFSKIETAPDETYRWNLPPHKWSLPLDPGSVSDSVKAPNTDIHTKRRGVIFVARKYNGNTASTNAKTGKKENTGTGSYSSNYGFQFLWNPETFNQSTSVNWGITPDQNDRLSLLTGLVSANSTIDFTLRIDRTNDFACAKANTLTEDFLLSSFDTNFNNAIFNRNNELQKTQLTNLAQYYRDGQAPKSGADFAANIDEKLKDLLRRGTEADLEFLYRTINGDGYTTDWGTSSSNISFLLPTIIRLDLGPQKLVGMVQSVNVTHLAFTREMIPIRTDVSLSIDLRTAIGLTTNNFGASSDEVKKVTGTK